MISFTVEGETVEECANNMRKTLTVLERRLAKDAQTDLATLKAQRQEIDLLSEWFEEQTGLRFEKFLLEHFGESRVQDIPQFMWPEVRRKMLMQMGMPL